MQNAVKSAFKLSDVSLEMHEGSKVTTPNGVSFEISSVTPEKALSLLNYQVNQEDLECPSVDVYAQLMSERGWVYNAQPILIGEDGKIIDGKKRLLASVRSGESFTTLIASDVKRDVVHTIDQHRRRNYAGVLQARGFQNAASVIRIMNKVIRMERGLFGKPSSTISWGRFEQVLELNEGLIEAAEISEAYYGSPIHSTARPVIAFMALKSGKEKELFELFDGLKDPFTLPRGNPVKELSIQLQNDRARKIKPDVDEMIVMGIQAINDLAKNNMREKAFGWVRDYGSCRLDASGKPTSLKAVIEEAPANLGMPQMDGYPGINLGESLSFSKSALVTSLTSAACHAPESTDLRYMEVTPQMAAQWLEEYNVSNRKVLKPHVNSIARDILNGNWMFNAQPIAFHGDPELGKAVLLNGQHRLEACVVSNQSIDVLIATGLPKEAFSTFDIHMRRGTRGKMSAGDERVIIAAAKIQWRVDNNMSPLDTKMPSSMEVQRTIERHPSLIDAFRISRKKEMQGIASSGILTFFIAHIKYEHSTKADVFIEQLMYGEGLERENPLIRVRNILIGNRGEMSRREVLAVLLDCWENFLKYQEEKEEVDSYFYG